ncbi:MAG: HupE/UreJ family protein [Methylococcaceae bacterium]|nr:HupE/UreJ family protein [Methylococcaceae bacterium]
MRLMWLLLLAAWSLVAHAHKPSDSYLSLKWEGSVVQGQWDIALRDLDYAIGLDGDDDGAITWGELLSQRAALNAYALARLRLRGDGADCPAQATDLLVDDHSDGKYAVLHFAARCPSEPSALGIDYSLFFDLDPQHRGLLRLERGGRFDAFVFGPQTKHFERSVGATRNPWREWAGFAREGVWHIWIGYDHLLFLLSLLLPAALVAIDGQWRAVAGFRRAAFDVVKIVTAFTLAHSITLSLAALGYLALPSRGVESAIAASVAAAALNNIGGWILARRSWLAFGFGLVHGLGFASVLLDLGLPSDLRLLGLVGFNLGVEVGQLAVVAALLPLIVGLSRFRFYTPVVMKFGSCCIAAVAFLWLAERGAGFSLPSF